jgi:hypothetical protein
LTAEEEDWLTLSPASTVINLKMIFKATEATTYRSTYWLVIKEMASEALSTFIIGSMGPNISSCIIGSVGLTSVKIVGAMNLSDGSLLPPTATLPLSRRA